VKGLALHQTRNAVTLFVTHLFGFRKEGFACIAALDNNRILLQEKLNDIKK
tara:strand:+ start:97 stop:249 length:153 start_codon:yes stop_codon:yes gene_type:complete